MGGSRNSATAGLPVSSTSALRPLTAADSRGFEGCSDRLGACMLAAWVGGGRAGAARATRTGHSTGHLRRCKEAQLPGCCLLLPVCLCMHRLCVYAGQGTAMHARPLSIWSAGTLDHLRCCQASRMPVRGAAASTKLAVTSTQSPLNALHRARCGLCAPGCERDLVVLVW